jgi:hypothetical protein
MNLIASTQENPVARCHPVYAESDTPVSLLVWCKTKTSRKREDFTYMQPDHADSKGQPHRESRSVPKPRNSHVCVRQPWKRVLMLISLINLVVNEERGLHCFGFPLCVGLADDTRKMSAKSMFDKTSTHFMDAEGQWMFTNLRTFRA